MHLRNIGVYICIILFISCQEKKTVEEVERLPATRADNAGLFLPDGFEAKVVSEGVGPSRHLAVNDNGDIYVKLSEPKGFLGNIALRDTNNDSRADIVQRFGDYPNDGAYATEMRIHNGYLYFSSELVVYRQKLIPGQLIPEGKPELIMQDPYPIRWHNAKTLAFDKQGGMYVTFSAPTNACEDWRTVPQNTVANVKGQFPCEQLGHLGGIWKFDEAKLNQTQTDGIKFATGLRSIVGMSWNELDNSLYAVNHGRDYLYGHAPQYYSEWQNAVLPGEQFMKIQQNDDFGWPYTYYDHFQKKRFLAPEYGGNGVKEAPEYASPIMGLPAHWAPNDLLFYTGDLFPARYRNGAFIAFHGSTNRTPYPQGGYIVAFVPYENGKFTDEWEVFADGFAGVDIVINMSDAKYRPMGLAQGPDGSLYISESTKGKIWRILFGGDAGTFGKEQLAGMEKRKAMSYIRTPGEISDRLSVN